MSLADPLWLLALALIPAVLLIQRLAAPPRQDLRRALHGGQHAARGA